MNKTIRRITTAFSIYEIDGLYVKRVLGINDPTPHQGPNGLWKEAVSITEMNIHGEKSYLFNWGCGKVTWTSIVVEEADIAVEGHTTAAESTQP